MYEPQEDSFLMEKIVKKYSKGIALDMGTGSGIQAKAVKSKKVVCVDIDKKSLQYCKKLGLKTIHSDLFENVKGKFDTIIFNPPYLPQDPGIRDSALYGGKKGYEVIERFVEQAGDYLTSNGIILLLFSTHTNKEKIEEMIEQNLFVYEKVASKKLFFEELYVYKIEKDELRKKLDKVIKLTFLSKGRRGLVYSGYLMGRKVAVKIKNPQSMAVSRIENEANFLRIVNKKGIGPKLFESDKDYLIIEFIEGRTLDKSKLTRSIIENLDRQMKILDSLGINKLEMQRPYKNVIIRNGKPVLIDFERCKYSQNPKNLRQFEQFKRKNELLQ